MKITKSQLKQIIKEELRALSESTWSRRQSATDPEGYNVEQEWEQEQKLSTDDDSIAGRDIPNEEKYPTILIAFKEILDSSLGGNYNLYQELQKIADFSARQPK